MARHDPASRRCDEPRRVIPATTATPAAPASPVSVPSPAFPTLAAYTEAEALAFLVAFNDHEIAIAQQSRGKPLAPEVRIFADSILTEHSLNLAATRALARMARMTLIDTPDVKAWRSNDSEALETLGRTTDDAYPSAWLDALIEDLAAAMDLIDKRLLSVVGDERFAHHMRATRTRLAALLLRAQELKSAGN